MHRHQQSLDRTVVDDVSAPPTASMCHGGHLEGGHVGDYTVGLDLAQNVFQARRAAAGCTDLHPSVDRERIGMIGICGWGGMALNEAAVDNTMYIMPRVMSKGYDDSRLRSIHRRCGVSITDENSGKSR